jgi:hypothetical protein
LKELNHNTEDIRKEKNCWTIIKTTIDFKARYSEEPSGFEFRLFEHEWTSTQFLFEYEENSREMKISNLKNFERTIEFLKSINFIPNTISSKDFCSLHKGQFINGKTYTYTKFLRCKI